MGRLGCLLQIFAFVWMGALIVVPVLPFTEDNQMIDTYLTRLLCQPDETIERHMTSSSYRPGETSYSMSPVCIDLEGQKRDVSDTWGLLGTAGFLIPFLIGLTLFIVGVSRASARALNPSGSNDDVRRALNAAGISTTVVRGKPITVQSSSFSTGDADEIQAILKAAGFPADMLPTNADTFQSGATSLSEKLRELQEARDSGLISEDEYQRLRQEILDNMA